MKRENLRVWFAVFVLANPTLAMAQTPEAAPAVDRANGVPVASAPNAGAEDPEVLAGLAKGQRYAEPGTFYLLNYVSVMTDKGVEGFPPGQKVHLVEVHKPTHTLVVSDGRAQVEVPPSQLTNDRKFAAMVRRNDRESQAQIAAYIQEQQETYAKRQKDAALATDEDIDRRQREQAEANRSAEAARSAQANDDVTTQVDAPVAQGSYDGGYGYGSPYSYFTGGTTVILPQSAAPAPTNLAPSAPAAAMPGKVAAPPATGGAVARPR